MATDLNAKAKGGVLNNSLLEIIREGETRQKKDRGEENSREELSRRYEKLNYLHSQDQLIFTRQHEEEQAQVKTIQEELKRLAQSVQNLDKEIVKTVEQIPVEPGVYHLNFLEKIKQIVILLKKRVEEASTWLEIFNQKAAKRQGYHFKTQKFGTQYSQSSERYVATSTG